MRVRYHGSRTLDSLVAFYSDVTGMAFYFWSYLSWDTLDHKDDLLIFFMRVASYLQTNSYSLLFKLSISTDD